MAKEMQTNSQQLRTYAMRIRNIDDRIRILANQINAMKFSLNSTVDEKAVAYKVGNLHNYRNRLDMCENYLLICADEIDTTVNILLKQNVLEFIEIKMPNYGFHVDVFPALSGAEKEKAKELLYKIIEKINPEAIESIELYKKIFTALNDPVEGSKILYEDSIKILEDYLCANLNGSLAQIGIKCFINMTLDTPEAILEGTDKYFANSSITDVTAWVKYFSYLGEQIVVDNILETAESLVNTVTDNTENVLKYFGIDVNLSISDVYEEMYGVGGVEGYKKGMGELAGMLYESGVETYFKVADNVSGYVENGYKLLSDGVSQWGEFIQGLF